MFSACLSTITAQKEQHSASSIESQLNAPSSATQYYVQVRAVQANIPVLEDPIAGGSNCSNRKAPNAVAAHLVSAILARV